MTLIATARDRVLHAGGVAELLDAAYEAFEGMLAVIRAHEDPDGGMFTALVMAAGSAADGRDAVAFAPSLPRRRLHPEEAAPGAGPVSADVAVAGVVDLSGVLAARMADAAGSAPGHADRQACREAARCARDVQALLTGGSA